MYIKQYIKYHFRNSWAKVGKRPPQKRATHHRHVAMQNTPGVALPDQLGIRRRHSRESGNPFLLLAKGKMDSHFRGNDGNEK
jgi:hypothetical protein